jgi:hypothetical protein
MALAGTFPRIPRKGIKFTSTVFLYSDKLETDILRSRLLPRVGRERLVIACGQSTRFVCLSDNLDQNAARGKIDRTYALLLHGAVK